jgi:hypothetical protein
MDHAPKPESNIFTTTNHKSQKFYFFKNSNNNTTSLLVAVEEGCVALDLGVFGSVDMCLKQLAVFELLLTVVFVA